MREFWYFQCTEYCDRMGAEPLQWIFLPPKSLVHATVSLRMLRAVSGAHSALEFRTQSRNEQAQMESGWELPVDS